MERVVAQTKYNRKQHKEFYMFHLKRRSGTLKFLAVIVLIMLVLALMNTFDKSFHIKKETGPMIFAWVMFAVACSFTPILIISRINSVIKQETPERINSTEKIEVTKIKFTRTNDLIDGKSVFGWTDIEMICETDKYFYIYLQDDNGIFIVKDDIIEGDIELFRKWAMNNLHTDRKGRPLYKRYGQVKKDYKAMKKEEKRQAKLGIK